MGEGEKGGGSPRQIAIAIKRDTGRSPCPDWLLPSFFLPLCFRFPLSLLSDFFLALALSLSLISPPPRLL